MTMMTDSYRIEIFNSDERSIGKFYSQSYADALDTYKEFIKNGFSVVLYDKANKVLFSQNPKD